ncbi:MAG: class I SAM-dependent methyltransferase [bacterium]
MEYIISETLPEEDYELLDSGDSEKLERYGGIITRRPDPQALWPKKCAESVWNDAHAVFGGEGKGRWVFNKQTPDKWRISIGGLNFWIKPFTFKHVGVFPEHVANWKWIEEQSGKPNAQVLNLFGYTGGATLAAARGGASVVHLDASRVAVNVAKENAEISELREKPVRWILDDASIFVRREMKRGKKYDGIIMDPPAFGHGADGEVWKIEEHLVPLVENCRKIMTDEPTFFLINGYASGYSALAYKQIIEFYFPKNGVVEIGELTIQESGENPRNLPAGIFARWSVK